MDFHQTFVMRVCLEYFGDHYVAIFHGWKTRGVIDEYSLLLRVYLSFWNAGDDG